MGIILKETTDYDSLVDLFERSGLEIHKGEPRPEGLVTCFELTDEGTGQRCGASGLCCDKGEYIARCVAVEEPFRGRGYGIMLVNAVIMKALSHGADRIWLTAKVPGFYKKFGFHMVPMEQAPIQTKCKSCPQYHNGCESEVMVLNFAESSEKRHI